MELKRIARRALALLLTAAALAGPLAAPASRTSAETEFDTGGSAFTEPSYTTGLMYFWHRGLPTVAKDKQGNYIKYPVIISWAGQYYLCTDANFKSELNETHKKQEKKNGHYKFFGIGIGYVASDDFSFDDYDRVWGDTEYYMRYKYDTTSSSLLTKLGLDINSLRTLGEAVSMTSPSLPYLVVTKPETDQYAIGLDEKAFGKDVWLVGRTRTWEWVETSGLIWKTDSWMGGVVQWGLDYESWKADKFCDKNYTYKATRTMYDVDTHKSYEYTEGADQHYWTVKKDSAGLYHFWTMGENEIADWGRITGSYGRDNNRKRMREWYHANDVGRMSLYYSGSTIGASAETVKNKDWKNRNCTVSNTDGYTVYYADPNIVSFHKDSFEVVKGQVVSLDGPRVIDQSCTVTVRDGGVLACNGWVINNGQILVEPGGMLILTERETATGDKQYGAITSVVTDANTAAGRIACDGTIIVNRDCKLTCAGTYGLQLGEGAQVVNYGQIIAENLMIYGDHTIENRGDSSAVFAGWGVTDSGYALTRTQISDQTYNAKGTLQKAAFVNMPRDAVYGDGASRFYVNGASSVIYTVNEKSTKGYVSGFIAKIEAADEVQPELPANIPIYNDDRYDVAYITVDGTIYQYDGLVGRWVNVADGAHETFFDYRFPDRDEEYKSGKLPDGFVLMDGRVVGAAVNDREDLRYDVHANVYWFTEDAVAYYYEKALGAYIHVYDTNTYFRYPGELAPPPTYSRDMIPTSMWSDLPMTERFYSSSMQEIDASAAKPKVQKDDTGFYIVVSGYRLDWSKTDQLFIDAVGALSEEENFDADGNRLGLSADMVNLNGYDLNDPGAKPKVQQGKYESGNVYYYIIYQGNMYVWYAEVQEFYYGTPDRAFAPPIQASEVDLNGYTLP